MLMDNKQCSISHSELGQALEFSAQEASVAILTDTPPKERNYAIFQYFLCHAIVSNMSENGPLADLTDGLVQAGIEAETAQLIHEQYGNKHGQRTFLSLSYIPADQEVAGIKRNMRSISVDETEFIKGLLQSRIFRNEKRVAS